MASILVTIDRAGRVVIPQELRQRLSLTPNTELEIDLEGDVIRLMPRRRPPRGVVEVDGVLVLEPVEGIAVTDLDVQRWRDADQR
ncbi:MAG: AbrB/MazE/SpoVT family DNA-binding domain-containing protein [Ilumatobacteraceae bacterium]